MTDPEVRFRDDFLVKEYESATALTNHVDNVRSNLTNFFVLFAGAAATASGFLLKAPDRSALVDVRFLVGSILLLVAFIGLCFIAVLARLRRVQVERYGIIKRIRAHLLGADEVRFKVIGLDDTTLPNEARGGRDRRTGTYFWVLVLLVPSVAFFACGVLVLGSASPVIRDLPVWGGVVAGIALTFLVGLVVDRLYWSLVQISTPAGTALAEPVDGTAVGAPTDEQEAD